ncbi:MAG: hypothetical protein Q7R31_04565 [Candidatus Levybacteria bacterium]|nr:hypothetical protein [Candidatus Levybacteria bacterium]
MGFFGNKEKRNRSVCPYCDTIFPKPPKRKTRCEKCGGECFVRTKQTIFNSDLLTEEGALAVDFFKELQYLGATIKDYLKVEAELSKKWGTKPKSYDVVWRVSNRLIMQPGKVENDYDPRTSLLQHAKMVAFAQAMYQAKRGNDPLPYLKNARITKHYSPSLCALSEKLYSEGKYSECLEVALDAHERAKLDAQEEWRELIKGPPSKLASMTKMWDTTTQQNLKYDEYIKCHNWEDDILPGPLGIAEKARKKLGKK